MFNFIIDLDERGEFRAHVENADGEAIYEVEGYDIFEDGFMRHKEDMKGLQEHLVSLEVIKEGEEISYIG